MAVVDSALVGEFISSTLLPCSTYLVPPVELIAGARRGEVVAEFLAKYRFNAGEAADDGEGGEYAATECEGAYVVAGDAQHQP